MALRKLADGTYVDPYEIYWVGSVTEETYYGDSKYVSAIIGGVQVKFELTAAVHFLQFVEEWVLDQKKKKVEEEFQSNYGKYRDQEYVEYVGGGE